MKKSYLVTEDLPREFKLDFDPLLFNLLCHRKLQSKEGWQSYYLLSQKRKKVLAAIHFCIKGGIAYSPFNAPYGSLDLSPKVSSKDLFEFMEYYECSLKSKKVKKLVIKSTPQIGLRTRHNLSAVLFLNRKFCLTQAEVGACIAIDSVDFGDKIDSWERRKLRQSIDAKLTFKALPLYALAEVYAFLLTCRTIRGQSLSMTLAALETTIRQLEEHFFLFGVYRGNELVAASVTVRVNSEVAYNFYSAHSQEASSISPVVFLLSGIYKWCKTMRFSILDLGTSALEGEPNFSLIDFKLRLGALPTMKATFEKKIT